MEEKHTSFEGWAVVEMFGHSREAGFVTTEYFGTGALFRVEVPELAEREVVITRAEWVENKLLNPGSKIRRCCVQGRTRFIGPGAIYAMNPCSQEAVLRALESMTPRKVEVIELVESKQLVPAQGYEDEPSEDIDEECR